VITVFRLILLVSFHTTSLHLTSWTLALGRGRSTSQVEGQDHKMSYTSTTHQISAAHFARVAMPAPASGEFCLSIHAPYWR
jgi:hypothetical protein